MLVRHKINTSRNCCSIWYFYFQFFKIKKIVLFAKV